MKTHIFLHGRKMDSVRLASGLWDNLSCVLDSDKHSIVCVCACTCICMGVNTCPCACVCLLADINQKAYVYLKLTSEVATSPKAEQVYKNTQCNKNSVQHRMENRTENGRRINENLVQNVDLESNSGKGFCRENSNSWFGGILSISASFHSWP